MSERPFNAYQDVSDEARHDWLDEREPAERDADHGECSRCDDTGLVEAPVWRWQVDRWKPCPNGCQPPPLKMRTLYECHNPACGKASRWTGDLGLGRQPRDHLCPACGTPWTELVIDGSRYKVEWEMPNTVGGWATHNREDESRKGAVDQYEQLAEWERTGEEAIRNVRLYRGEVTWKEVDP